MTPSLPASFVAFLHDVRLVDIPDRVREFGRRCLLDLIGVAAAGRTTELSSIIFRHVQNHFCAPPREASGYFGQPCSQLMFDGTTVSPVGAALANAMTIDSIDAHDGHRLTKGHTGAHQLPALLSFWCAENLDDDDDLLASLIVGYEIATRCGISLHETATDYHTSGAWGAVGCAALGARLLGFDARTTAEALGTAEYHGPRSQMMRVIDHPTMLKDGAGWGAMAGVSATYLARDGFTGAPAVTVTGEQVGHIWEDLGERWIITEQYFKPHPVCRWAQPAVEATLGLCRTEEISHDQVVSVEVRTFHEAARLATARPVTTEQAQYSLPFPVAAAIVRRRLTVEDVTEGLSDPVVLEMARRVTAVEDATFNDAFPARRFAVVSMRLDDGRVVRSEITEARGDPEDHLPDEEIRRKFEEMAVPVLGAARAADIQKAVSDLGRSNSKSLVPLLFAPI